MSGIMSGFYSLVSRLLPLFSMGEEPGYEAKGFIRGIGVSSSSPEIWKYHNCLNSYNRHRVYKSDDLSMSRVSTKS